MALEPTPPGVASDGNGLVVFCSAIADPSAPTAAELTAGEAITYSITGDGYNHEVTENTVTTNRLTLKQQLEVAGTVQDTVEVTYAATYTASDVARTELAPNTEGFIVERWGVANEVAFAASQIVTVIPVKAGVQRSNAPSSNTELTMSQKLFVTGPVQRNVTVAA